MNKDPDSHLYALEPAADSLPFTGERYTPEVESEIALEHLHRYLLALPFCRDKEILDVACGEGYGAALLGSVASRVTGVDSARDAIDHCQRYYASQTVDFQLGEATALPLDDSSVDVVVSFETIEHFAEHDRFLAEVERVLRPGGLVLLSTPDRLTYGAISPEPNEFHVRELDLNELMRLLRSRFRHVVIGGQQSGAGSSIVFPKQTSAREIVLFDRVEPFRFEQHSELSRPMYLLAVASSRPLPRLASSVFNDRAFLSRLHTTYHGELEKVWKEVTRSNNELTNFQADAARLTEEVGNLTASFGESQRLFAEVIGSTSWRVTAPLRALNQRLAAAAFRFPTRLSPPWRSRRLRLVLRRSRKLRALRDRLRRYRRQRRHSLATSPLPERLLGFAGEGELPAEIRDDRIAAEAAAWRARVLTSQEIASMADRPLISVVMPTFNTPVDLVRETVESVLSQTYPEWELCIVDDGSTSPELHEALHEIALSDSRIRVHLGGVNRGIAAATNEGLQLSRGEFVGFLDHDDELLPDALLEVVRRLNTEPDLDAVYTDQSYIEQDGTECDYLFKPDWSPTLFRGVMYVGHLLVVRRELATSLGGFDSHFDNVQDFEFMLRLSERTDRIAHIPKVLYRWRRVPGSVALSGDAKPDIEKRQAAAVTGHFHRLGIKAAAEPHPSHAHRARFVPNLDGDATSVGLILAGEGDMRAVSATLSSLQGDKARLLTELVVWQPQDQSAPEKIDGLEFRGHVRSLAKACDALGSDFVLCLEAGIAPISDEWLAHLLLHAQLADAGVTGGVVLAHGGNVEDAGLITGLEDGLSRAMQGWDPTSDGYAGSLSCAREVSAISGNCAMAAKGTLDRLGISPHFVSARYAWVDLSLRARRAGLRNVITPDSLVRRVSRDGAVDTPAHAQDLELLKEIWQDELSGSDPYHNPNFTRAEGGYRLGVPVSR